MLKLIKINLFLKLNTFVKNKKPKKYLLYKIIKSFYSTLKGKHKISSLSLQTTLLDIVLINKTGTPTNIKYVLKPLFFFKVYATTNTIIAVC